MSMALEFSVPRVKGKAVTKGARIGIVAPGGPPGSLEAVTRKLVAAGFEVAVGRNAGKVSGYTAGSDDERAADLNFMFSARNIDAIVCAGTGYGGLRLLQKLNYEGIRENPKLLIARGESTAIALALRQKAGLVSYLGPLADEAAADDYSMGGLLKALTATEPLGELGWPMGNGRPQALTGGTVSGELVGGHVLALSALLGTPYDPDTKGKILWLEVGGVGVQDLDRAMTQLALADKLSEAAGFIIGRAGGEAGMASDLFRRLVLNPVAATARPALTMFPLGAAGAGSAASADQAAVAPQALLPLGARVTIETSPVKVTVEEAASRA